MAPRRVISRKALLESLEKRLTLLAQTLDVAEIAEKSVEIVKEIKELHALLRSIREPQTAAAQRLVVVWGGPEQQGASASGPGRLAASPLSASAAEAPVAANGMTRNAARGDTPPTAARAKQTGRFLPCDLHAEPGDTSGSATSAAPHGSAHETTGEAPRN